MSAGKPLQLNIHLMQSLIVNLFDYFSNYFKLFTSTSFWKLRKAPKHAVLLQIGSLANLGSWVFDYQNGSSHLKVMHWNNNIGSLLINICCHKLLPMRQFLCLHVYNITMNCSRHSTTYTQLGEDNNYI